MIKDVCVKSACTALHGRVVRPVVLWLEGVSLKTTGQPNKNMPGAGLDTKFAAGLILSLKP